MSIKKVVTQLEKHMSLKFPEYNGQFYANRRNYYVHLGSDKSLFSFENYKNLLEEVNSFNIYIANLIAFFHQNW